MVVPPNARELKARLLKRGSEDEDTIQKRMQRMEYELSKRGQYDYTVVNDKLEAAVDEINGIIKSVDKK